MFLRVVTTKGQKYLQLCEGVRVNGKPTTHVVHSFGNLEKLGRSGLVGLAEDFLRVAGEKLPGTADLTCERTLEFGAAHVARGLWDHFGLSERLARLCGNRRIDVAWLVQVMVLNRLLSPRSKLAAWEWAPSVWWPQGEAGDLRLRHYYRALDALVAAKEPLEQELWRATCDLFNLEVDLVFYDLTSTYFEGRGPDMAEYGYSRDKRPDREQIVVALACDRHGFPIAHEVHRGKTADKSTLVALIDALGRRFRIRRCVLVADSGLVSSANRDALSAAGYPWVMAVRRSRVVSDLWAQIRDVPVADYVPGDHRLRMLECPATDGVRTFCCYSEPRAEEQRQIRAGRQRRGREALDRIAGAVRGGRLRAPQAIAQRVGKLLAEAKASQWYSWSLDDHGAFEYRLDENREREHAALDGRFFLQTDDPHLTMADVVDAYYTLQKVEHAFREMKDFLRLRPVYHYREHRVRAHVFVCVLAYLLETALEARLTEAGMPLSARRALDKLARIHLADNDLSGKRVLTVTRPAPMAAAVVAAVGLQPLPRVVGPVSPRE
jgi:hypothetical protein